jgi:hypothetical protein
MEVEVELTYDDLAVIWAGLAAIGGAYEGCENARDLAIQIKIEMVRTKIAMAML